MGFNNNTRFRIVHIDYNMSTITMYMNNVCKDRNGKTYSSRFIWHSFFSCHEHLSLNKKVYFTFRTILLSNTIQGIVVSVVRDLKNKFRALILVFLQGSKVVYSSCNS